MTFSATGLVHTLQTSFSNTGVENLVEFVLRHRRTRRWIIASDFNLGSVGAAHSVFAFAAYPTGERNYHEIIYRLRRAIPADFKGTRLVSRDIKRFFEGDDCFCFVILAPTTRMFFRNHADHEANRHDAIDILDDMQSRLSAKSYDEIHADIRRLRHEARKRSFSLPLLENILIFTIANAFVSYNVTSVLGTDLVGWFPDRDNMTTYAGSAWAGLAHANFHGLWTWKQKSQPPNVGLVDHRIRGTNDIYDPLIRVPDYLAATFSRWDLAQKRLLLPDGMTRAGKQRYHQILGKWAPDNRNLWVGRIYRDEDGNVRSASVSISRSKSYRERLKRLRGSANTR